MRRKVSHVTAVFVTQRRVVEMVSRDAESCNLTFEKATP